MNKYLMFKELNDDNIISLYTKKPFDFDPKLGKEKIEEEYKIIQDDLKYNFKYIKKIAQVHGNKVIKIDENNLFEDLEGDGIVTNLKGIALEIRTADCQSILLYDKKNKVIGNIHSGWRGTLKKIIVNAINLMKEEYNTKIEDLIVVINPSICGECFEVEIDVINLFKEEFPNIDKYYKKGIKENKYYLDTLKLNKDILIDLGIKEDNLIISDICTMEDNNYFSYRRDGMGSGRNISIICLK